MLEEKSRIRHIKMAYLHGRPSAHPLHQKLANIFQADFYFADAFIRWQDRKIFSPFLVVIWFLCGLFQKNVRKYNLFLVDNLHVSVVFTKYFRLNRKSQKIIVHLGSHTLFFIKEKRFSAINLFIHKWALKNYDAIICEGKMAVEYLHEVLPEKRPMMFYSFNGLTKERITQLHTIRPKLDSKNILTITQVSGASFRLWYKGIDIMLEAFAIASIKDPLLKFIIVGSFDKHLLEDYLRTLPKKIVDNIIFTGYSSDLLKYYADCSLYLHTSRGDAFPTTTLESLCVGIPTLVSNQTGTKEIVKNVSSMLVCELDPKQIASRISEYFDLSAEEKLALSDKCRIAVSGYTEEKSFDNYRRIIEQIRTA
jgi:glycosyltransferase involved in cell wall biosynthesis